MRGRARVPELNEILSRIEPLLGPLGGEPAPLGGGITNTNFRATLGGEHYVLRIHGANTALLGIDRGAERHANEVAAALGIAPEVAASVEGCLVTRYVACEPMSASEVAAGAEGIARALRSFHESGAVLEASFWVPDLLVSYEALLRERGARASRALEGARAIAVRIAHALPAQTRRPCHNDLLAGNIIRASGDRGTLMLVDWEYAGMGHPLFDLGNLSVNNGFDEAGDERLLLAYDGRPPTPARVASLKLMRVLSDAREAAWGALQARISELDFDFGGYASAHFERLEAAVEDAQFEEWLAAAQG
jgi:thiamine kinase-like enzyme